MLRHSLNAPVVLIRYAGGISRRGTWHPVPIVRGEAPEKTGRSLFFRAITTQRQMKPRRRDSAASAPRTTQPSAPKKERLRIVCAGCGVGLQSRDHVAAGYIPTLKRLEELQAEADAALSSSAAAAAGVDPLAHTFRGHGVVCQRCFQAKHYGKLVPITIPEETFRDYLNGLRSVPSLVALVCDVFDFHASLLTNLRSLILPPDESTTATRSRYGHDRTRESAGASSRYRAHDVLLVVNKVRVLHPNLWICTPTGTQS
jgi:hypothetical protein